MQVYFLLFVPGIRSLSHRERFTTVYDFPRGALSLATFLNTNSIPTAIIPLDYYIQGSTVQEEIDREIFHVVESAIREYRPAVVGVSCPYTMLYPVSVRILEWSKEIAPGIVTVIGGPHVSYLDRECLEDSEGVDFVVRGEGEWTLAELLGSIRSGKDPSGVMGITLRSGGEIKSTPLRPPGDINDLPPLDYGLLPEGFVRSMGVSIVGSRGCAYRCTYCNESRFWGQKVRRMPVERIVEEIRTLADRYDNYAVGLEDSMFNMKGAYFFELMERLKDLRLNPGFYILSRVDTVSEDGFRAMREAGVRNLVLGIESTSPKVLRMMNKRIDPEGIVRALKGASRYDLIVGTFWIIGHPGDSMEESQTTLESIERFYREGLMHTSEIALFVPYPGTDIFERPDAFGVEILTYEWERWGRFNTEPVCQLKDFSKEEIMAVWRKGMAIAEEWRLYRTMEITAFEGVSRNSPCPCGSGKKFKRCCGSRLERTV